MHAPNRRRRRRWTVVATSLAATLVVATLVGDTGGDRTPLRDSSATSAPPAHSTYPGVGLDESRAPDGQPAPSDSDLPAPRPPKELVLTERMPAADALNQLDDEQVAHSAALVGRSPADYRELVTGDSSYWMDRYGATYVVDPAPEHSTRAAAKSTKDEARATSPTTATTATLSETEVLSLHSNPDSTLKLFIDVKGSTVPEDWRDEVGSSTYPAWDPAGDGARLSADERVKLEAIWSAVAADYEPFNIDITTEDPGRDGLLRTHFSDSSYGVTIALTDPAGVSCDGCAGIAYLDTFDATEWWPTGSPAGYRLGWAFSASSGHDIDAVAQTISHEAGHTLNLEHDDNILGSNPVERAYYFGHGHWNAIMGGSNASRIHTQWSRGDYVGATNHEDDVTILASKLGLRATVDTSARSTAASMVDGRSTGLITSAHDVDLHSLGSCGAGKLTLRATPTRTRSNLDIELTLLDRWGPVALDPSGRTTVNPENSIDTSAHPIWLMRGLAAEISTEVPAGAYWVQVRGGGNLTWADGGYDSYGSTGSYELTATCAEAPMIESSTTLTVTGQGTNRTLTATVTRDDGQPADGQVLFTQDGAPLGLSQVTEGTATHVVTDLRPDIHQFAAEFVPADADRVAGSVSAAVRIAVGMTDLDIETRVDGRDLHVEVTVLPADGKPFVSGGTLSLAVDGFRSEVALSTPTHAAKFTGLVPGLHELTATYTPPASPGSPISRTIPVTMPAAGSTTTLRVTGTGTKRTLVAEVIADDLPISGSVTFTDNGVPTSPITVKGGRAEVVLSNLIDGDHEFQARFAPDDPTFLSPSFSSRVTTDVVAPATVDVEPSLTGNIVTLTITVGPRGEGEIDIFANGRIVTTYRVSRRPVIATFTPLPGGRHTLVVTYRPAAGEPVSRSVAVTVPKLSPAVTIKAPKKVRKGKKAKLVAIVGSNGEPVTGKVRFTTKGWKKTVWLNAKGKAKVKGPKLFRGTKQKFVVRYLGDDYTKKSKKLTVTVRIKR